MQGSRPPARWADHAPTTLAPSRRPNTRHNFVRPMRAQDAWLAGCTFRAGFSVASGRTHEVEREWENGSEGGTDTISRQIAITTDRELPILLRNAALSLR